MSGIFKSVGQALHVSYLLESLPSAQPATTQLLIDGLKARMGVVDDEERAPPTVNFAGLTPLEVRGQCALVRMAVERALPGPERHAVHARFGHQTTRAVGVRELARYCQPLTTIGDELTLRAVAWTIFGPGRRKADRLSLRDIEREMGLSYSQLQRAGRVIRAQSNSLLKMAEARLQPVFERSGVIGDDDELLAA